MADSAGIEAVICELHTSHRRWGPGRLVFELARRGYPRVSRPTVYRICRENGITQRLTRPRSPATAGKIERLHQMLQLELLHVHGPFATIEDAQTAVDAWRKEYNADRPHQSLAMAYPAARFAPAASDALGLRVPAELARQSPPPAPDTGRAPDEAPVEAGTCQITVEPAITITAPPHWEPGCQRHKASNYSSAG